MKIMSASLFTLLAAAPVMAQTRAAQPAPTPAPAPQPVQYYDRAPWWVKENVITQTGYVYAEVPANRAHFSANFLAVGDTAEKAQAKAIEQTRALNQVLGKFGKDAVRVTTSFSMRVLYDQYRDKNGNLIENQRGDKIESYQVTLNINVEVRDMAALEKAYALVLAASPTYASDINFSLQPTNEQNAWLYNESIKDARQRATSAASAAGTVLADAKVIDPTGRACNTDILGRDSFEGDGMAANDVSSRYAYAPPPPPPPPPAPMAEMAYAKGSAEYLEAQALKNPFIQTPPLQRIEARSCVVYGLK